MQSTKPRLMAAIVLAVVFGLGAGTIQPAQAQTFTVLANIGSLQLNPSGLPIPGVVRDAAGNVYGTTPEGGITTGPCATTACGTVFKVDTTGTLTVLYKFTGGADGYSAKAGVILDTAGNLYGASGSALFKLDTSGTFTLLYSGAGSLAGLVRDTAGNLYGVNEFGGFTGGVCGNNGCGIVFKLDTTGTYTVLYSFTGQPDGAHPTAGLVLDPAGNLYGTTQGGGAAGHGTVFKLDTSNTETVVYSFTGAPDGDSPQAGLTLDAAGNLYGTTYSGGLLDCFEPAGTTPPSNKSIDCGVVFKVDTTGTETVLHAFSGIPDGALPVASLVMDAAGELYGTTVEGGSNGFFGCEILNPAQPTGCGSIFKLDPATGALSVLYSFSGNLDFGYPVAGLAVDPSGNLYGTAISAVFQLDPLGTPNFDLSVYPAYQSNNGSGTLTVNGVACPANGCSEFFTKGTSVTLTATPAAGSSFAGWSAPCSGTGPCTLIINSAELIWATFNLIPPDFSVSATALTPASVSPGASSTSTLTVAAVGGFSGFVALTCAVTPTPALAPTCSVSPSSVAPGTPATLTVSTTPSTARTMSSSASSGVFYALCLPLIGLVGVGLGSDRKTRKGKLTAAALVVMLFAGLVSQIACGGGSTTPTGSKGTPLGTYTITVTGTDSTGSLVHTTPTTLTVQ